MTTETTYTHPKSMVAVGYCLLVLALFVAIGAPLSAYMAHRALRRAAVVYAVPGQAELRHRKAMVLARAGVEVAAIEAYVRTGTIDQGMIAKLKAAQRKTIEDGFRTVDTLPERMQQQANLVRLGMLVGLLVALVTVVLLVVAGRYLVTKPVAS